MQSTGVFSELDKDEIRTFERETRISRGTRGRRFPLPRRMQTRGVPHLDSDRPALIETGNHYYKEVMSIIFSATKRDYEDKFRRYFDQMFNRVMPSHARFYGRRGRHSQENLHDQFLKFYKVRTCYLPTVHLLYWLGLVDFQFILNQFFFFMGVYGEKYFESQLDLIKDGISYSNQGRLLCFKGARIPFITKRSQYDRPRCHGVYQPDDVHNEQK